MARRSLQTQNSSAAYDLEWPSRGHSPNVYSLSNAIFRTFVQQLIRFQLTKIITAWSSVVRRTTAYQHCRCRAIYWQQRVFSSLTDVNKAQRRTYFSTAFSYACMPTFIISSSWFSLPSFTCIHSSLVTWSSWSVDTGLDTQLTSWPSERQTCRAAISTHRSPRSKGHQGRRQQQQRGQNKSQVRRKVRSRLNAHDEVVSHAGCIAAGVGVGGAFSRVCICLFVCLSALSKENDLSYQHQTWYTYTL